MRQLDTNIITAPTVDIETALAQFYNQGWMELDVYKIMIRREWQNGRVVIIPAIEGMIDPEHLLAELHDSIMGYHNRMPPDEDD